MVARAALVSMLLLAACAGTRMSFGGVQAPMMLGPVRNPAPEAKVYSVESRHQEGGVCGRGFGLITSPDPTNVVRNDRDGMRIDHYAAESWWMNFVLFVFAESRIEAVMVPLAEEASP